MDRDGFLTMRGRFAELIEVGGITWFPRDVEEALCAEPGVREAAVVAIPDARLGHRPVAFVTLMSEQVDLGALKQAAARRLSFDPTPLEVRSVAAFPMTPTGKIAKANLRERALVSDS